MTRLSPHRGLCLLIAGLCGGNAVAGGGGPDLCATTPGLCLQSLQELSIKALRQRSYRSSPRLLEQLGGPAQLTEYDRHYSSDDTPVHPSFLAAYVSDGLRVYARLDIPRSPPPPRGYPLVIFAHGWIGREDAPTYDFGYNTTSLYGEIIDRYTDAGFAVLMPGYRGHGTVKGVPAAGIEWMDAWDNGSYLAPSFYAIDTLNLLEGVGFLNRTDWTQWGFAGGGAPTFDLASINLLAHSQGGDVALTALAVSGEGSRVVNNFNAASIWCGNIADRFTQVDTFGPMAATLQAFMSGDGSWTGSAVASDGSINSNFVFAWPPDWIVTLDQDSDQWGWQAETWSTPTVAQALRDKYTEMYNTLNRQVADLGQVSFSIGIDEKGKASAQHSPGLVAAMMDIGGYHAITYLTEPLALHYADQDYYSLPRWNIDLARRINASGGRAYSFSYPRNNHSLKASRYHWFSPVGTSDGLPRAVERDRVLFAGAIPE